MMSLMTYGERFRELRESLGMDQMELATRLFGSRDRQPSISAIEQTAGRVPRPGTVYKHAKALECRVSDLVGAVTDTWLDRARRGEIDRPSRVIRARDGTLDTRAAKR